MRARLLTLAGLVLIGVSLTACTESPRPDRPVTTVGSGTPTVAPSTSATASVLQTPDALPGEITRSTFTNGTVVMPNAALPRTVAGRGLRVRVACSGPAGSSMDWSLVDADANRFGPAGTVRCTGEPDTVGDAAAGVLPKTVRVELAPDKHATGGYGILTKN